MHHQYPHHHAWFYNAEEVVSAATYAAILRKLADAAEAGVVPLGSIEVALPAQFDVVVRHERAPHGALVLKIEAEWPESALRSGATLSLSELLS